MSFGQGLRTDQTSLADAGDEPALPVAALVEMHSHLSGCHAGDLSPWRARKLLARTRVQDNGANRIALSLFCT